MATNPFLGRFGFDEDPFASTNAGEEPRLTEYFVPPPYFHAVLGDPVVPQSHVVLAPRGGGKTAQRRMVENFSAEHGAFLCVTYDRFDLPPGFRVEDADLAYHLQQVCRSVLLAVLFEVDDRPELAERLTDQQKQILKFQVQRFLGGLSAAQYEEALRSIKSRSERLVDWLKRYGVINALITAVSAKLGLGSISLPADAFDARKEDESLRYHFARLVEIAATIGFTSTYILVDRVDELGITATDASATYRFVHPLVTDLPTLESEKAAFKFFMWDQIEAPYREGGARPDRVPQFRLQWTIDQLADMLAKRLAAFSGDSVGSLNDLVCDDVDVDLHRLVSHLAHGSPRDMIRLCQRIVAEQTIHAADAKCLDANAIWSGIRVFARERAGELFGEEYLDQLSKVGRPTFTISHLASNVYRVTANAARSRVQKWQDTGLVTKVAEEPSKGRPQYVYGITDVRLAIAVSPGLEVPLLLGNFVIACPACGTINISDQDEIDCLSCGTRFKLGNARSLLDICSRGKG